MKRGEIGGKKCSNCFRFKPLSDFYRKLDRYQARCKACNAEVVRAYHERLRDRQRRQSWRAAFDRHDRSGLSHVQALPARAGSHTS